MTESTQDGLDTFFGQKEIVQNLQELITIMRGVGSVLPHMIFKAPEGMGKITLAKKISESYGCNCVIVKGQNIIKAGDLSAILSNLRAGSIFLIEEIQGIGANCIELLLTACDDFALDIIIGKGSDARSVRLKLPHFTVIGTSSEPWKIPNEIRKSHCFSQYEFSNYTEDDIQQAIIHEAKKLSVNIDAEATNYIQKLAESMPGKAISILRRIVKYSPAMNNFVLTYNIAQKAGRYLGIEKVYEGNSITSEKICSMDGIEFEHFVATIFRNKGYSVTETAASGDHGIDLFLRKNGEEELVQCKVRSTSLVGEPIIRDFFGAIMNSKAKRGYFVTTSKFTNQAIAFSQGKPIILVDINMLVKISNS